MLSLICMYILYSGIHIFPRKKAIATENLVTFTIHGQLHFNVHIDTSTLKCDTIFSDVFIDFIQVSLRVHCICMRDNEHYIKSIFVSNLNCTL